MKIFKLKRNDDAWGHIDWMEHQRGAVHIPVDADTSFTYDIAGVRNHPLPDQIFLAADYTIIPEIDFLVNNLLLDILSKKMLEVLKGMGAFTFQTIPVVFFDQQELEAYHIEDGELLEDLKRRNEDYVVLKLTENTAAFDEEYSEYEEHFLDPEKVGSVDKMVLKEPKNGFPPIFKIEEGIHALYVTEKTRNALEAFDINGIDFEEVEVSK